MVNKGNGALKQSNIKKIPVKTESVIGTVFAQIVGIVVTDTFITLEFAYLNPRPETKQAYVVSRVTLPKMAGENLAKIIIKTIKEHENRKGGKNG